MENITFGKIKYPINIDWNDFKVDVDNLSNFSGNIVIYVDDLIQNQIIDIKKIEIIKMIPNISKITIVSRNFEVAKYFDYLLKNIECDTEFDLLNDFKITNRDYVDFKNLNFGETVVPFDYLMWIKNISAVTETVYRNINESKIIKTDNNKYLIDENICKQLNNIIDEIFADLPLQDLDDIDKSVLVSNWIQKHIQFIEGKISHVNGREYYCDNFDSNSDLHSIKTVVEKRYGVCESIAKLSVALLSNPKVGCKCNIVTSSGHAYFVQNINSEYYVCDNTWCITRNNNHYGECLKATLFSDEYLLVGMDKIKENENTLKAHTPDCVFPYSFSNKSISRKLIQNSIKKLKGLGIKFEYNISPIFTQYVIEPNLQEIKKK